MIDIVGFDTNGDLIIQDATAPKAANVCSVQLGSLEYAPSFGVDLDYFIQESIKFQNDSFKSYLVERLAQAQINVAQVVEVVEALASSYTFSVSEVRESGGLIA